MNKAYAAIQNLLIIIALILVVGIGGAKLFFGLSPHIVISGSMEPEIMTGSLCFINERDKDIKEGDIIAFKKGETLITHRVVDIEDSAYITKGDNNDVIDPAPVLRGEVEGKNVFWIPKLGYALAYLKSVKGMIISFTFIVAFILIGTMLPGKETERDENTKE